jgi:hypothetical protein
MRVRVSRTLGRALLFAATCAATFGQSTSAPASRATDSRPPPEFVYADFSSDALTRRAAELLPFVEAASGLKARAPFEVRSTDCDEMKQVIDEERALLRAWDEDERGISFEQGNQWFTSDTLTILRLLLNGDAPCEHLRYVLGTNRILAAPRAVFSMRFDEVAERADYGQSYLDALLVRELAIALIDQAVGIPDFSCAARDAAEAEAIHCALDGFVEHFTEAACAEIGLSAANARRRFVRSTSTDGSLDLKTDGLLRTGEHFIAAVVEALGRDAAFDRVFNRPPRSFLELTNVPLYLSDTAKVLDDATLARSIRDICATWCPHPPPALSTYESLALADLSLEPASSNALLREIDFARTIGGEVVGVAVFLARDTEGARKLLRDFVDHGLGFLDATLAPEKDRLIASGLDELVVLRRVISAPARSGFPSIDTQRIYARKGRGVACIACLAGLPGIASDALPDALADADGETKIEIERILAPFAPKAIAEVLIPRIFEATADPPLRAVAHPRARALFDPPRGVVNGRAKWANSSSAPPKVIRARLCTGPPGRRFVEVDGDGNGFQATVDNPARARVCSVWIVGEPHPRSVDVGVARSPEGVTTLELYKGKATIVTVKDENGRPIPSAVACGIDDGWFPLNAGPYLVESDPNIVRSTASDDQGRILLDLSHPRSFGKFGLYNWRIVAPGFAAGSPSNLDEAGDDVLVLKPGGELTISVPDSDRLPPLVAFCLANGDEIKNRIKVPINRGGRARVLGLQPGWFHVGLYYDDSRHDPTGPPIVLRHVQVRAGSAAFVELVDPSVERRVVVKGTFRLPVDRGYGFAQFVELVPIGANADVGYPMRPSAIVTLKGSPPAGALRIPGVAPGPYMLEIPKTLFAAPIDVREDGRFDAPALPPLRRARFRVVDADSGEPLEEASVTLRAKSSRIQCGEGARYAEPAELDTDSKGRCSALIVDTEFEVHVGHYLYAPVVVDGDVSAFGDGFVVKLTSKY